jgi:hypothetical protein
VRHDRQHVPVYRHPGGDRQQARDQGHRAVDARHHIRAALGGEGRSNGALESATSARASTQAPVDTSSTRPITSDCTLRRVSPPATTRATAPAPGIMT